jgi:hypothetical protein
MPRHNWLLVASAVTGLACQPDDNDVRTASGSARTPDLGESLAAHIRPLADSAVVDLTSPDRAIRTYWRLQDIETRASAIMSRLLLDESTGLRSPGTPWRRIDSLRTAVLGGEALAERQQPPDTMQTTFAREIVEVKQETETRAIVIAKLRNTTPIKPGVVVDESDAKRRRDGDEVRYVLEKDASGWKVAQAMRRYYTGDQWRPYFTPGDYIVPTYVSP